MVNYKIRYAGERVAMGVEKQSPFRAMALMSAIVSQLVGAVLVGVFAGKTLDGYVGTSPLFLVIGLLLGLSAGIFSLVKLIQRFQENDSHE